MGKKILSLDLGITSIGYSVLEEMQDDRYSFLDYGVSMFDKPMDKDGNSKKLLHSASSAMTKLYTLRKKRKQNLAKLFEDFHLATKTTLLHQEKQNIYINKWELRTQKAFKEKLEVGELFTVFYALAKHRGYKSLDSGDLLEELCETLGIELKTNKTKKDDERGQIKNALKTIEKLRIEFPEKTVAQIIYDTEIKKENPTFRNHDSYNYMIRREYINDEIKKIILSQKKLQFFSDDFDVEAFIKRVVATIDDQKDSTNDLSLFGFCEYYKDKEQRVAHQYSLLSDIFKMYQSVSNITFNKKAIQITKEQIKLIADDFFSKLKKGVKIESIRYKDVRKILNLGDDFKIFNKEDSYVNKGKKQENNIIKFHFVNNLSKINNQFILDAFEKENKYEILKEIFDVLAYEKAPHAIYEKLKDKVDKKTIVDLIKYKDGSSLRISHYAMIQFIPYFKQGFTSDEIKKKLGLERKEDYSAFKKGIKYLHINNFENDDNLKINNHPVKYVVSATLRVIKHLHSEYGAFDEIRVESTRELSQNEQTKKDIEKANRAFEKELDAIVEDEEYQKIAERYGKNLRKYARKILLYKEQEGRDIYSGKGIELDDIFTNVVDLDHIVPQSLGGLSVKHNFVLAHRDTNVQKSNQLPINFVSDKQAFINRVEYLFQQHKINWKKRKNLLASSLDEVYKEVFESKSLRATSYIEALTVQILKRYYPFKDEKKQQDGSAVRHIQGRATSNIRKLLGVKTKVRDTNIHHAIDAILIGFTNQSWLQKLSNTFRENMGVIDDEAQVKIRKDFPIIELIVDDEVEYVEPKKLCKKIEENYNEFGEDSVFYRDLWGRVKVVNFWVSKKPMVSKIHKDTIYAKKSDGIFTVREGIINKFVALKVTNSTSSLKFRENFEKNILYKMYLYKTNPKDVICLVVQQRAKEIASLLDTFVDLDKKDKELMSDANSKLEALIHSDMLDNNGNIIRKVKFYQTNLTGFDVRGGLATKEKTFIGFKAWLESGKLKYERIDVANFESIKKENDASFKVFKNDVVFFIYPDGSFRGGKIVSFLEGTKTGAFQNPRFPMNLKYQPKSFCETDKQGVHKKTKPKSLNKAIGIIKLSLDITGNIKSYQAIGSVESELLNFIKESING